MRNLALRDAYARKAILQIPRLLSLQDRNPFSPTYGCFHRDYWLYKTSDFPDAVRQFGVHALALVYKESFPANIYQGQSKIREWTFAGMNYWTSIQHPDGSFDEFYPYERGWVGPSAFTTFSVASAVELLRDEMPADLTSKILDTIALAARFIMASQSEEDHLANHHAMACLAVWKAYQLLGGQEYQKGFERLWAGFLDYHNKMEGWSREYDGVDPGYLSATVSFLGKIYKTNRDLRLLEVLKQSVQFCSYFVYPNGFYAGSIGSRNTLHFYPDGFEILGREIPLAASVAEKMLEGLSEDKLVPPEIMSDRYVFYRVPEFLESYLDYAEGVTELPPLPYEGPDFTSYFPDSRIFAAKQNDHYVLANLAKGGVTKIFDAVTGKLLFNDCGFLGQLNDGKVVTSQWIDPAYECHADEKGCSVSGNLQLVPSNKLFTPMKNLLFRAALVVLGPIPAFSHWLKGAIRKSLMLGRRPVPIHFHRRMELRNDSIAMKNEIRISGDVRLTALSMGDEFFVRYVPQSRFFQSQELTLQSIIFDSTQMAALNQGETLEMEQVIVFRNQQSNRLAIRASRRP